MRFCPPPIYIFGTASPRNGRGRVLPRSFLSYTRHDYFRRILCNLIGEWVENGEYPNDEKALEKIVKGICFDNAKRYFAL